MIYLIIASIGACINGSINLLYSFIFSTLLNIFTKIDKPHELRSDVNFWAGMFVVLAGVAATATLVQQGFFILSGGRLTKKTSYYDIYSGFFDGERNNTGALT